MESLTIDVPASAPPKAPVLCAKVQLTDLIECDQAAPPSAVPTAFERKLDRVSVSSLAETMAPPERAAELLLNEQSVSVEAPLVSSAPASKPAVL